MPRDALTFDNDAIAKVLDEIADLLELKGENVFRAVTYRAAARAIRDLREPLTKLAQEKRLKEIPKVGPSVEEAIEQLIATGSSKRHQELQAAVPPGLLTLLRVSGVGPATARTIYDHLRITTIEELEEAAREHRLRQLPKIQAKTEENILRSIAALKQRTGRSLLHEASAGAAAMLGYLEAETAVERIAIAGSLRRSRETIGDVDIVVGPDDAAPIMDAFARAPSVQAVLARGATKAPAAVARGYRMDWRVEMARTAKARGYAYFAVTDHSPGLGMTNGLSPERIEARIAEASKLNEELAPFRIIVGTEVDIRANGKLDYPDELLARFDVVSASVHSSFAQPRDAMTARITGAMRHPLVTAISHPTGRLLEKREPYAVDLDAVIETAIATGTWIEVNGGPERLGLPDTWIRKAQGRGVTLVVNSDAHAIEELDWMDQGIGTARRGWATAASIANTRGLDAALAARKGRR